MFNANEIAENLQKQGGFIEGVRPGIQTEKYLSRTVNRLILFGSIALGIIAVMPFGAEYIFAQLGVQAANLAIGGTGLLIVVSVGLESLRQINSRALMVTYDDYKYGSRQRTTESLLSSSCFTNSSSWQSNAE